MKLNIIIEVIDSGERYNVQYCPKVLDSKCANFVLCSRELSSKVRSKVREKFRGI